MSRCMSSFKFCLISLSIDLTSGQAHIYIEKITLNGFECLFKIKRWTNIEIKIQLKSNQFIKVFFCKIDTEYICTSDYLFLQRIKK